MSLARAFTTRRVRQTLEIKDSKEKENASGSHEGFLSRSRTTKIFSTHNSIRHKISAPVELTHTTNMLSYNAPDIVSHASPAASEALSSPMSSKSDDESDSGETAASTPPTSPDTPAHDDKRSSYPEPNHLSCYFTPQRVTMTEASGLGVTAAGLSSPDGSHTQPAAAAATLASDAPAIPQRSPSHTKKASYDGLARHRSVSRMSEQSVQSMRSLSTKASFSFSSRSSSSSSATTTSTSHSLTMKPTFHTSSTVSGAMSGPVPPVSHKKEYSESHPFGHELAKVSELVEEFGREETVVQEPSAMITPPTNPIFAEEERELLRQGLKKHSAESYISDIQSLMAVFFTDARPAAAVWI